jgi:hypothetical protein
MGLRKVRMSAFGGEIRVYAVRVSVVEGGMGWMRDSRVERVNGME